MSKKAKDSTEVTDPTEVVVEHDTVTEQNVGEPEVTVEKADESAKVETAELPVAIVAISKSRTSYVG